MEKKRLDAITRITFVGTTSTNSKVVARATVEFETFTLGGFKIIKDDEKTYVTPPSYLSKGGWRMLFTTKLDEDWEKITNEVLEEYDLWLMKEAAEGIDTM